MLYSSISQHIEKIAKSNNNLIVFDDGHKFELHYKIGFKAYRMIIAERKVCSSVATVKFRHCDYLRNPENGSWRWTCTNEETFDSRKLTKAQIDQLFDVILAETVRTAEKRTIQRTVLELGKL